MHTKNETRFVVVNHNESSPAEAAFAARFGSRVIGQPAALEVAQAAYNLAKNPLRDRTRPIGIFFLAGPSRTGKSLTAVCLAEIYHNNPDALTRIPASDYTEDHEIQDLKGAPPSYVGYRDPKDPKNKLDEREIDPYSKVSTHNLRRVRLGSQEKIDIVVIEEFEKASPDFFKFWMGVFDKGVAQLRNGEIVDFTNTIFILTSNIGMDRAEHEAKGGLGFISRERKLEHAEIQSIVGEEMRRAYKPEFRNRLDAVVVFKPFDNDSLFKIVDAEVELVQKRINEEMEAGEDFLLDVTAEARKLLLAGVNFNVAELKRSMSRELLVPLGRLLAAGHLSGGDTVRVGVSSDGKSLEFAIAAGAYGVSEVEASISKLRKQGNHSPVNLGLQREIRKVTTGARSQMNKEWVVMLSAAGKNRMAERAADLHNTMASVLEMKIIESRYTHVAPYVFSVVCRASREQINLLARLHAEDELSINEAGKSSGSDPEFID